MSAWSDVVWNVLLRFFPSRKQHGTELRLTCVSFPLLNGCNRSEIFLSVVYWPETELSELLQEAPETVEMRKLVLETRLYYYQKQLVEICELPATPWSSSDFIPQTDVYCFVLSLIVSVVQQQVSTTHVLQAHDIQLPGTVIPMHDPVCNSLETTKVCCRRHEIVFEGTNP